VRRRRLLALPLAAALVFAAACSVHMRVASAVKANGSSDRVSVCVLFCDGLSAHAFSSLLAQGALPNIKRQLVDPGLVVDTAVASVPSETYPNLSAMLTGLLPGHHGIPANIWIDRKLRRPERHTNVFRSFAASAFLEPTALTLFERLPHDTVALTTPIARGAAIHTRTLGGVIASYARNDWAYVDLRTLDDAGDAYAGAAEEGRLPSLVWAHLFGIDECAHADGPDSEEFRKTLATIDAGFGRLVRRLARRGILEKVLFVLVGDHGNAPYATYVDAEELVHRALFSHPMESDCSKGDCYLTSPAHGHGARKFDVGDTIVAVGAYRGVMVWLPGAHPVENVPPVIRTRKRKKKVVSRPALGSPERPLPPRSELAVTLSHMPPIQLVVTRGTEAGTVEITARTGRALITREDHENDSFYAYRVMEGEDPLGYSDVPEIREELGKPLAADRWLRLTAATEYPDLPVQLPEFFDSPRAPDILLSPREGFGFTFDRAAGHGSLTRLETVVPLVFSGPGVTPGHRAAARTVDLAPTLLRYLGLPFDASTMDGDDLGIGSAPLVPAPVTASGAGAPPAAPAAAGSEPRS
jgi:hypothetical protein